LVKVLYADVSSRQDKIRIDQVITVTWIGEAMLMREMIIPNTRNYEYNSGLVRSLYKAPLGKEGG
jgi:hypothetical protein